MNCDFIARWYRWLEYSSFGSALHRRRCYFLPQLSNARKVLMLGEGDGRFLAEFARQNPDAHVDYVDRSRKMLKLARERTQQPRVNFCHSDAVCDPLPNDNYDTIITHFFLDCLSEQDLTLLLQKIAASTTATARWVVSEFREPSTGWQRLRARLWIGGLYRAFWIATGLATQRLPDYSRALLDAGFTLESESLASSGLLTSQLWKRE